MFSHVYIMNLSRIGIQQSVRKVLSPRCSSKTFLKRTISVDPTQVSALGEMCIVIDEKDKAIGQATKEDCHRVDADNNLILHRAFSVFLFNSKNELLIQKRSEHKITFPNHVTNSCCSHPLYTIDSEKDENNALGVKVAALRRLNHELGIPFNSLNVTDLKYLTRIMYKSVGDGVWGEYEIDYVLFAKKDVPVVPNKNEISEINYVSLNDIHDFVKKLKDPLTPWFDLILKSRLIDWWKNIDNIEKFEDHKEIHHFQ